MSNIIFKYSSNTEIWNTCLEYFNHQCAYCGKKGKLQKEHIIPRKKYDCPDGPGNLIPACSQCNYDKNVNNMEEWYGRQKYFSPKKLMKIKEWMEATFIKVKKEDIQYDKIPFQIMLSQELFNKLRTMAFEQRTSIAELVRKAINEMLEREEGDGGEKQKPS